MYIRRRGLRQSQCLRARAFCVVRRVALTVSRVVVRCGNKIFVKSATSLSSQRPNSSCICIPIKRMKTACSRDRAVFLRLMCILECWATSSNFAATFSSVKINLSIPGNGSGGGSLPDPFKNFARFLLILACFGKSGHSSATAKRLAARVPRIKNRIISRDCRPTTLSMLVQIVSTTRESAKRTRSARLAGLRVLSSSANAFKVSVKGRRLGKLIP